MKVKKSDRKITKDLHIDNSIELKKKTSILQSKKNRIKFSFWDRRKLRVSPDKSFIVTMMFNNGTLKTFIIRTKDSTFTMKGKTYYLYYEETWFDLSLNQYHLFFHEAFSVPINREVLQSGNESFFAVTPENLKSIIKFEYVKVLAGAHSIANQFKILFILIIVNILMSGLMALKVFGK